MAVSYNKLWHKLKERGMTKKELMARTGISSATVSMLSHDKEVSLSTLSSICGALNCDIGDIVSLSTNEQQAYQATAEYVEQLNQPLLVKYAIELYLDHHHMSKNGFVRLVGISVNTLTRLLEGKKANLSTYKKIMAVISPEFMQCLETYGAMLSGVEMSGDAIVD